MTSEDSDQPVHLHSLIRVIPDRMCLLQPPGYLKRDEREPMPYWVDIHYRLICVFACHTGLIVGFVMRWLVSWLKNKQIKNTLSGAMHYKYLAENLGGLVGETTTLIL